MIQTNDKDNPKLEALKPKDSNNLLELKSYIGQEKIIKDLRNRIDFSKKLNEPFPHIMLCAQPGMGKVALAQAVALEFGISAKIIPLSEMQYLKAGDIASIFTNLNENDILIISEFDRLKEPALSMIIDVIQQFPKPTLDVVLGKRAGAKAVRLDLPYFSIIATTSKPWQIDDQLRRWFVIYDFDLYNQNEIRDILITHAYNQGFKLNSEAAIILAKYCNSSSGNAGILIKRIAGFVHKSSLNKEINSENISQVLQFLGYGDNYPNSLSIADDFSRMSGIDFEQWVANYFRNKGYTVEITKTSGDHGIDLLLRKSNKLVGAVQCKRWIDSVGEPVVRDFYGSLLNSKAENGYIFTTSTFTPAVYAFTKDKPIELVDLEGLIKIKKRSENINT